MSHLSASPADELEVKARVDDPEELRAALVRAGAALEFRGDMIDRRFDRDGTLAERDHVLRLREYRPADGTPRWSRSSRSRSGTRARRPAPPTTSPQPS